MMPGLSVSDLTGQSRPPRTDKIDSILIMAARREQSHERGFVPEYQITEVPTEAQLEPLMGDIGEIAGDAYRSIKRIAPECRVFMICAYIPFGGGIRAFEGMLEQAINPDELPLSIILCPELDHHAAPDPLVSHVDRMPAHRAIAKFAAKWGHLYYFNLGKEVFTYVDAVGVARYLKREIGPESHAAGAWFGWGVGNSQPLPLAVDAAAWTIQKNQFNSGIYAPSGIGVDLLQPVDDRYSMTAEEQEEAVRQHLFNFGHVSPKGWGLAGDALLGEGDWMYLAVKLACLVMRERLLDRLNELMFYPVGLPHRPESVNDAFLGPMSQEGERAIADQIIEAYEVRNVAAYGSRGLTLEMRIKPYGVVEMLTVDLMGES